MDCLKCQVRIWEANAQLKVNNKNFTHQLILNVNNFSLNFQKIAFLTLIKFDNSKKGATETEKESAEKIRHDSIYSTPKLWW